MTQSFIERQFPVSKVSKESYKERKANNGANPNWSRQMVGAEAPHPCTGGDPWLSYAHQ